MTVYLHSTTQEIGIASGMFRDDRDEDLLCRIT
jgi:hypothetical protein